MMTFDTLKEAEDYIYENYEWFSSKELLYYLDEFIFKADGKYVVPEYLRG